MLQGVRTIRKSVFGPLALGAVLALLSPLATLPAMAAGAPLQAQLAPAAIAVVGTSFSELVAVTGGVPPYSFALSGELPDGLAFDAVTGKISGTPTDTGQASVQVAVRDSASPPASTTAYGSIQVVAPLRLGESTLAAATVGLPYQGQLAILGGSAPYSWTITSGSLPAGLGLSSVTGAIYGTPTQSGTSTFGYQVTDFLGEQVAGSAALNVGAAAAGISLAAQPSTVATGGRVEISGTVVGAVYEGGTFLLGPLPGAVVSLSTARGGGGSGAGDIAESTATGPTGSFQVPFDAPESPGAVTVTGTVYSATYGSHSAQAVVLVTPADTTTEGSASAVDTGGCGGSPATYGDTQESGCGAGVLAVAQYSGQPALTGSLGGAVKYFDAAVSAGNSFSSVTIRECGLQAGEVMEWWNQAAGAWQAVSPTATYQSGCLSYEATGTTSPSIADLTGTVFSIVLAPTGLGTQTQSAGSAAAGLSPLAGATVTGLSPAAGPATGGTLVTLSGSGFSGATAVSFGTAAASSFAVVSDSEILAVAPPGSGPVPVQVTVDGAQGPTGPGDLFTYRACAPAFSDVSGTSAAAVDVLACNGVVQGYPDGTFDPAAPVTRAEFVAMLDRTLGLQPGSAGTPFTDVAPRAWYAPYVAVAAGAGLLHGLTPTTFAPGGILTREQVAILLARALRLTATRPLSFSDAAGIAPWAATAVQEAVAAGYLKGFPDGTFRPAGATTREQAALVLARVLRQRA